MTINPRTVHVRISSTSQRLDRIVPRITIGVGNVIAGTKPDVEERQRPENAPGVKRKGWTADPTGESAVGKVLAVDGVLDDLDAHLATIALAVSLVEQFVDRWAPTTIEVRLCGDMAPSEYRRHPKFRADCRDVVETNPGSNTYRSSGLCANCRRRIDYYDRRHGDAA